MAIKKGKTFTDQPVDLTTQDIQEIKSKLNLDNIDNQSFSDIQNTVNSISAGEGGLIYDTLAEAQGLASPPSDGTIFQVSKITDVDNAGFYSFQSGEPNGTRFEKPFVSNDVDDIKNALVNRNYYNSDDSKNIASGEIETLKIITDFIFEYTDETTKDDRFLIQAFAKTHNNNFFNYIELMNINTSILIQRDITSDEVLNNYLEINLENYTNNERYKNSKIKIWFDLELSSEEGLLISSSEPSNVIIKSTRLSQFNINNVNNELFGSAIIPDQKLLNKYYKITDGVLKTSTGYKTTVYPYNKRENTDVYATSKRVNGTGTALAVFFDESMNILGYDYQGTSDTNYFKQKLTIPENTRFIALSSYQTEYPILHEAKIDKTNYSKTNHWANKKVVWLGTSVPFGQRANKSYALEVSKILGFDLVNASVPGLALHANDDGSGGIQPRTFGSSSLTIQEYADNGTIIPNNPVTPYIPGGSYNDYYRTWENSLTAENADADLWVYDVVPNNSNFSLTDWNAFNKDTWSYNDGSSFADHRTTFLGALLYVMDKMYDLNPNARMVLLLGSSFSYDNGKDNFEILVNEWNMPLIDAWGKINISPRSKNKLKSESGTNPHPSAFGHEIISKTLSNELLLIA